LNEELSRLISLQEIDVEIKRLKDEIAMLPVRRQELERDFSGSVKEYFDLKTQLETASNERKHFESELEIEQEKHQKFKNDLMKATNEREYTTAVREIDVARKAISSLETEILKLMEKTEKLEAQIKERTPEIESRRVEVDRQLAEWLAAAAVNQQRLDDLLAQRLPALEALSANARATYARLSRMRSGFALAEARDYSCLACRMKIRPQVFNDIRRGEKIITCESCGRILYFKAESATT
jgi:predicted  nucleic acid-binding Zn-ribbon protein